LDQTAYRGTLAASAGRWLLGANEASFTGTLQDGDLLVESERNCNAKYE
jgi:hypothetical protein